MTRHKTIGEQNYEQFADRYAAAAETKPHNAYYERPATLSLLPDVTGKRVLDAGCGPGIYAQWLVEHGAQVVAFDVTPRFVEIAAARLGDRATVLQADLNLPLTFAEDNYFDVVVCALVLDYLKDWHPTIREFCRVLKPGGVLVFSCAHPLGDYLFLSRHELLVIDNYFEVQPFEVKWSGFGDPKPLLKSYRRPFGAICEPVLAAGFKIEKILEPLPTEAFKKADPEGYRRLLRAPGFMMVRAKKLVETDPIRNMERKHP
jgi:SAM-dependent methyltransferase